MSQKATKITTTMDITLYLDKKDSLGLTFNKVYEPLETLFIKENIKSSMTIIDIGANIGYYTTIFSKLSENGTIFAFEPDTENFSLLKRNCHLNKFKNTQIFNFACGNTNQTKSLFISNDNKGDHRTYMVEGEERESKLIKMIRLDDFLQNIPKLDFVKLDIQGFEFQAIKGMSELIRRHKPLILMEFWPLGLISNNEDPVEFLSYLDNLNYDMHIIYPNRHNYHLKKIGINDHVTISETKKNDFNIVLTSKT